MLKFIKPITSDNEAVIQYLLMFVKYLFDLRINLSYVCYVIPRVTSCFVYNLSDFMLCLYVACYDKVNVCRHFYFPCF